MKYRFVDPPQLTQAEQKRAASTINRFAQGIADPINAGAQMLSRVPGADYVNQATQFVNDLPVIGPITKGLGMVPATSDELDAQMVANEEAYQAARASQGQSGLDVPRMLGNVTTGLALTLPFGAAGTAVGRMAQGAGSGAAMGALTPVTENQDQYWTEKAKQVGIGAVTGAAASGATEGIARVVKPQTSPYVKTLMDEGVTPTPGQIAGGGFRATEDKLMSIPLLGDLIASARGKSLNEFNRAAYRRALEPIGETADDLPIGREGINGVYQKLSKAYDDLMPFLSFKPDQQFAADVKTLRQMAKEGLEPQQYKVFEKALRDKVINRLTKQGNASGETIKEIESELGLMVRGYSKDPSFANRQLGDALKEAQNTIRQTLVRNNPASAERLQAINQGYAVYDKLRVAGARAGDKTGGFTPADLAAAVRGADSSVKKGAYARGVAPLQDLSDAGIATLPSRYPDSGTAGRATIAAMLGGAAGGAGASVSPLVPIGIAGSMLPYMPGGRQVAAKLMTARPPGAQTLADLIRASGPAAGLALTPQLAK